MEKIILKDASEIVINGATSNTISITATPRQFSDTYSKLTESNLSEFRLVNAAGEPLAIFKDKAVKSAHLENGIATYELKDVDLVAKKIAALEADNATLKNSITDLQAKMAASTVK